MSQRVLATGDAISAITQIKSILDGGFEETISNLKAQGATLSDPNVWDGSLAITFRSDLWPACTKALDEALTSLNELHQKLSQIQQNIMAAGGNV